MTSIKKVLRRCRLVKTTQNRRVFLHLRRSVRVR